VAGRVTDYRPRRDYSRVDRAELRLSVSDLIEDLALDAIAQDKGSSRLAQAIKELEDTRVNNTTGEIEYLGVGLRWEALLDSCIIQIEDEIRAQARDPENKLPAGLKSRSAKVIEAMARERAIKEEPLLYAEVKALMTEVKAMTLWLKHQERISSLRQSLLAAQRGEAALPSPPPKPGEY
jgi:hypothetical protein